MTMSVPSELKRRWLFAVYAVVPLMAAMILIDAGLCDFYLRDHVLPSMPEQWSFWTVLFGLPHVIAGTLTSADRQYLRHYRRQFALPVLVYAVLALGGVAGPVVLQTAIPVLLGFYTIYHLLMQQIGLTFTFLDGTPRWSMQCWKWLILTIGLTIYGAVFLAANLPQMTVGGWAVQAACLRIVVPMMVLLCGVGTLLQTYARAPIGRAYVFGNVGMIGVTLLAFVGGYTLVIILVPRVIHDLTAFLIYDNHDRNRNAERPHNFLYRCPGIRSIPTPVRLPLISILLAWLIDSASYPLAIGIAFWLTFLHYHMEAVIWRRPQRHRDYLVLGR